jgi:hypothetical protein
MSHYVFQFERGERFLKPLTRATGRRYRKQRSHLTIEQLTDIPLFALRAQSRGKSRWNTKF